MAYETLLLTRERGIALLTLNRPSKLNALTREMLAETQAALREIESGPERAAIITGAGRAFCAGMDLNALRQSAESSLDDSRLIAGFFLSIYDFPKPLIAAVNGHAVAGGCGLASLADITIAAPEAKFGYPEVRVGFMPAFVAAFLIPQIGEKRARDLLMTGRLISAEEARRIGLINEVVPAGGLISRAREIADEFSAASPAGVRMTKRLICGFSRAELGRNLEIAIQTSAEMRSTADFQEGLSAFLEKRKPRWL